MSRHLLASGLTATLLLASLALAGPADPQFRAGVTAYTRDGDRVAARAAFLKAIQLDPKHAPARFNLAMLAEDEERWDEAVRSYTDYLTLAGADDLYADVARRKVAALGRFAELDRTPEGKAERIYLQLVQRAQTKLAGGDTGAALALAELATLQRGDRFEGFLVLGVALMESERYAEAQTALDKAKGLAGADSSAELSAIAQRCRKLAASQQKVRAADGAFAAQDYATAADAYGQAWTLADAPELGIQAARAWSLAGERDKSLKIYDVLMRSPDAGTAAIARQERAQAAMVARSAGGSAPGQRPEFVRARELTLRGKYYEADAQLTLVLDGLLPDRGYAELYEARGVARLGLKEYTGAIADLTAALLLDPSRGSAYERRAAAHAGLGRYDEAARDIAYALERMPGDASRLRQLRGDYSSRVRP